MLLCSYHMSVLHNKSRGTAAKIRKVFPIVVALMQDDKGSRMLARLQLNHRSPWSVSLDWT